MATGVAQRTTAPFMPLSDRIVRFRDASRVRGAAKTPSLRADHMTQAFFELYAKRPFWERYARSMAYALEHEPVYTFADERLAGMLYQVGPGVHWREGDHAAPWEPFDAYKRMQQRQQAEVPAYMANGGSPGHVGWRWDRILERGIQGHMHVIREHLADLAGERHRVLQVVKHRD